jgi:two-component system nitrogen regulation response regulator GlnG
LWQSEKDAAALHGEELAEALSQIARQLAANPDLAGTVYDRFLQQVEPPLLAAVMDSCGKRFAPAARVLGLHRTTLKKKLTQYEMEAASES